MPKYQINCTLTWTTDVETNEQAVQEAQERLTSLINPESLKDVKTRVHAVRLKDRKNLVHLACFALDEVLPFTTPYRSRREYEVGGKSYFVSMCSDRYKVFKQNTKCIVCGLEGKQMILDIVPGHKTAHFNLYAEENGSLVLMTKDHILARSQGGSNDITNLTTMCKICNELKAHHPLTPEQCLILRKIYANEGKLEKKDLREAINTVRENMLNHFSKEDNESYTEETQVSQ